MKIARMLPLALLLSLLAACSAGSITGPDPDIRAEAPRLEGGLGTFGSGN
ncbi:MAG TPA: hypothetical protein VF613_04550 [Longimicrobium sp.]|jgi:hypothetical protein